jgi:ornithine cyclodeaminase/alanine dehydrogenase
MSQETLVLSRSDIDGLLSLPEYIEVVEEAFKSYATGQSLKTGLLHLDSRDGEFHIKAGGLTNGRTYFGVKVNGAFFGNKERFQLPNIQGAILLCDGENGSPLAFMDSLEITRSRTGAATAVAAKYLARPESEVVTICGAGTQARIQLRAVQHLFPITLAYVYSRKESSANAFATEMGAELGIKVKPVRELNEAIKASDICVTCTPAKEFFLRQRYVSPGTFVAAVGADSPDKQELEPGLLSGNKVVADILSQCATVGEIHHAITAGLINTDAVHAELGEIVAGQKPGRTSDDEITIFDSTGTALQDVAAAAAIYEKAMSEEKGTRFSLTG